MTVYDVIYMNIPPSLTTYLLGTSKVQEVENIQNHEWTLATLKDNLARAQNHMKQQEDQHRSK